MARRPVSILFALLAIATGYKATTNASEGGYTIPGGGGCRLHEDCFSGHCYQTNGLEGVCAPDSPINGTVAAGGDCLTDGDCFSNYCVDGTCASDSQLPGYVSGGGPCSIDDHCYSGVCYKNRCTPNGAVKGKTAGGGYCRYDDQCYSRFCRSNRCGPDSRVANVVPSGGHCSTVVNWCWSKVCYQGRCTAAGTPGKVADGGLCRQNYHCMNGSLCRQDVCVSRVNEDHKSLMNRLRTPGEQCALTSQCSSSFCVRGFCAPPSPSNRTLIGDGGQCHSHRQCYSGHCDDHVCVTSYGDHRTLYTAAAGASCINDRSCHSGVCYSGICSAESPDPLESGTILIISPEKSSLVSTGGFVAGGGFCHNDENCYSGYCMDSICAPDSPAFGTVADGGVCRIDDHCYSGYCRNGNCIASAPHGGAVAPGAACEREKLNCAVAYECVDGYCAGTIDNQATGKPTNNTRYRILTLGEGPCSKHAQCTFGQCLYKRCTVPWFVNDKWNSPADKSASSSLSLKIWSWIGFWSYFMFYVIIHTA